MGEKEKLFSRTELKILVFNKMKTNHKKYPNELKSEERITDLLETQIIISILILIGLDILSILVWKIWLK